MTAPHHSVAGRHTSTHHHATPSIRGGRHLATLSSQPLSQLAQPQHAYTITGLQSVKNWQEYFNSPSGTTLSLFNAIQNIGTIAGLPFAPYVSDWFGRRFAIAFGCCLMLLGTALQTACQNFGMFIAARGIIGFGLSFSCLASPVLITEIAFPTHRAPLTSMYNSTWYLGSIVAAWTTFGTFRIQNTWSWRIPSLLQGLPSILQLALIWTIPESPRWLVDHGKVEKAANVIAKYHCNGDREDPLVAFELAEIEESIRIEKENQTGWIDIFKGRGNLRRLRIIIAIAFFSQWSGNGLVSYYLVLVLNGIGIRSQGHQTLINGILQVYNLFWAYAGALAVDRLGRRFLFLTSTAGMCLSFVCWTICSAIFRQSSTVFDQECMTQYPTSYEDNCTALNANHAAGNGVLAFIFLFYAFYDIAMSPLLVSYTVEIVPFKNRSKTLMLMQLSVSAALVFNQYANPVALEALNWKYYIIYCVVLAFEFVYCYLFVVETRGKHGPLPLEEIAAIFDSPGAAWGFKKRQFIDEPIDHESHPNALDIDDKKGLDHERVSDVSK